MKIKKSTKEFFCIVAFMAAPLALALIGMELNAFFGCGEGRCRDSPALVSLINGLSACGFLLILSVPIGIVVMFVMSYVSPKAKK